MSYVYIKAFSVCCPIGYCTGCQFSPWTLFTSTLQVKNPGQNNAACSIFLPNKKPATLIVNGAYLGAFDVRHAMDPPPPSFSFFFCSYDVQGLRCQCVFKNCTCAHRVLIFSLKGFSTLDASYLLAGFLEDKLITKCPPAGPPVIGCNP